MKDSKERAAIITAISVIIAALIGGVFTYISRSSERAISSNSNTNNSAPSTPQPVTHNNNSSQPEIKHVGSNSNGTHQLYEAVGVVAEDKVYIDPETGFVFAVDEISSFLGGRGVLSRYTLPDGTREDVYRWPVGHRVDFQYQGRKFYMVIEDIDYDQKSAKIKIKEIPD
jgi:hypothetical protein